MFCWCTLEKLAAPMTPMVGEGGLRHVNNGMSDSGMGHMVEIKSECITGPENTGVKGNSFLSLIFWRNPLI